MGMSARHPAGPPAPRGAGSEADGRPVNAGPLPRLTVRRSPLREDSMSSEAVDPVAIARVLQKFPGHVFGPIGDLPTRRR
jgi:hypothetical protein